VCVSIFPVCVVYWNNWQVNRIKPSIRFISHSLVVSSWKKTVGLFFFAFSRQFAMRYMLKAFELFCFYFSPELVFCTRRQGYRYCRWVLLRKLSSISKFFCDLVTQSILDETFFTSLDRIRGWKSTGNERSMAKTFHIFY
jgi:hypothetical protein